MMMVFSHECREWDEGDEIIMMMLMVLLLLSLSLLAILFETVILNLT